MSLQPPIRMVSTVKCLMTVLVTRVFTTIYPRGKYCECLMTVLVTSVFTSIYPHGKYCEVFNDCPSN